MLEVWWVNGRPGLTAATFAVIVIGPLLSALLWLTRSWRRWAMVAAWLGFALLLGAANFEKMQSITRVVWDRKVEPAIRR